MNVLELEALAELVADRSAANGAVGVGGASGVAATRGDAAESGVDRPNNPNAGTNALFPVVIKSGKQLRGDSSSTSAAVSSVVSSGEPQRAASSRAPPADPKAIWVEDELETTVSLAHLDHPDGRKKPDFEIAYKQRVTSEDVFLNSGMKDPSTASCDQLVIKIMLPNTLYDDIVLDVIDTQFLVRSPYFKLFSYLPHTVNSARAQAQWDAATSTLRLILPIIESDDTM